MRMIRKLKEKLRFLEKKEANPWEVNFLSNLVKSNLSNQN
jgi:hypothetical protein